MTAETIKEFVIAAHFDFAKVQAMLAEDPALLKLEHEWGPGDFESPIGAAAHVGNRKIAEFLLAQGAPGNICVAAMLGHEDEVRAWLDADPALANACGAHGIPLMFHAAMSGSTGLADTLKAAGCEEGYSDALHAAIMHGHGEMVRWLLENGATELDVQDFRGRTLLQHAQESEQPEIAALLREYGATE